MADLTSRFSGPFVATRLAPSASSTDAVTEFLDAMAAAGIRPVQPIAHRLITGDLIRFRAEGDKPGRPNAWARLLRTAAPAGAFGSWRMGISRTWRSGQVHALTPAGRAAIAGCLRHAQARAAEEQGRQHAIVRTMAAKGWADAGPVDPRHQYLKVKDMTGEGLRQRGDCLLVPMCDDYGRIWNLQQIWPDGRKRFLKGGRTTGLFWMPVEPELVICIGEGVATVSAIRRSTGHAVIAAMSAGNLLAVTKFARAAWPHANIIVCADDDLGSRNNKGLEAAETAAKAVGAWLAVPPRGRGNG